MDVPSPCPLCGTAVAWVVDWHFDSEMAWSEGNAPTFGFVCERCGGLVFVAFPWQVEKGAAPRPLRLIGGSKNGWPAEPGALLVAPCPYGCGLKLGFRLESKEEWANSSLEPGSSLVLGGYRCPRCDGEGRVRLMARVEPGKSSDS